MVIFHLTCKRKHIKDQLHEVMLNKSKTRCTGSENIIQDLTKQKNSKRGALDVVSLYVKPAQDISSPQGSNLWKEIKSTPISQSTKEAIGRKKTKSQSAKKSKK